MTQQPRSDNVHLLPNTIAHAQRELTRMLEFERYEDACRLLRFLIGCQGDVGEVRDEWRALLVWLETMFPEAVDWGQHSGIMTQPEDGVSADAEEEPNEEELLRRHMQDKLVQDPQYADRLLQILRQPQAPDKQMLALEQLRVLDHPGINPAVIDWLSGNRLPSVMQYRALGILKERGAMGMLTLQRNGERVQLTIEEVPASWNEYPLPVREVLRRALSACERKDPQMGPFIEQTWGEFLAYAYGTSLYDRLLATRTEDYDAWACAFHVTLLQASLGFAQEEEWLEIYGVTEGNMSAFREASRGFDQFAREVFPGFL